MKEIATFEEVDDVLHCDDETGLLIRKKRTSNSVQIGDIAGNKHPNGYIGISVNGDHYPAHRIVWLLKTGEWPNGDIDHIDGDRSNNRFENLRQVDRRTNSRNQKLRSTNKSGVMGVHWNSRYERWIAQINDENGRKHLGFFVSKDDAIAARKAAEVALGYHPNHGNKR